MTVAHTSGAVSIEVFEASQISNFGCLYPVQTLTLHEQVDYRKLPLLIEGSSAKALADVEEIATSISEYVKRIDSDTRLRIHLACVFANNFTNHMLTIADDLLRAKDIPFDILEPLLKETISKAMKYGPENCQTGPAARNDQATMKKHLEMIVRPETKKIYEAISQRILESRQSKSTEE